MDGLQIQWLLGGRRLDMAAILRSHVEGQLTVPLAPRAEGPLTGG